MKTARIVTFGVPEYRCGMTCVFDGENNCSTVTMNYNDLPLEYLPEGHTEKDHEAWRGESNYHTLADRFGKKQGEMLYRLAQRELRNFLDGSFYMHVLSVNLDDSLAKE